MPAGDPRRHLVLGVYNLRGLGRRADRGADRGARQHQIAGVEALESRQGLQGLHRPVQHVAVDQHILPKLAVDPQLQPQITKAFQLVGIDKHQRRADRGEGWIRLRLVELGFAELHVAGRDVVGHHQGPTSSRRGWLR